MNIKGSDLITLQKCEKMYQLDKFMVTEKNKYYYISIAIKEVIKEILPLNNKDFELAIKDSIIEKRLNELLPDKAFLPLVKEETIKELVEQLKRYLKYIKSNNYRVIRTDITQDIKFNGELITVSADFIFKNNNSYEIVKTKRKAPELSYRAIKEENKPQNNIELYLLYLLGKHLYPNENISASFHHMAGKGDKKEINLTYEAKRGYNIINHNFLDKEDEVQFNLMQLINKTNNTKFSKTNNTNDCRVCSYRHICNYNKPHNIDLEPVEKNIKAPKDFTLTKSQRKAIIFDKGIARINAGAGSGKTTVVALRVVELISSGCNPEDILLITFTNKGASEMREKIAYWLKKEGIEDKTNKLNITTFNAWGNDIVMENFKELGFTKPPVLIDKVQKYDIIFELLGKNPKINGFDYKNPVMDYRYSRGVVAKLNGIFNYIKSYNATTPDKLMDKVEKSEIYKVLDMYKQYNDTLKERNLIEYQDQINLLIQLIENNNKILDKYNYRHIIVDEFQDTDSVQIDLIIFLVNQPNFESLMVVGDDSQSIFGFRNTSQENILNFHLMFNKVKDIEIIENFRSTPEIVALANALNDLNKNKIEKNLISGAKNGDVPTLVAFNNFETEYEFISKKIKELMKEYNPEDIAIIARTQYELFEIEEYLKQEDIPYIIDIPEPLLNDTNIHIAKSLITFLDNPEITQGIFEYLFIITEGFKDMDGNEIRKMIEEEIENIKETIDNIEINEITNDEEKERLQDEIKLDLFYSMLDLVDDKVLNNFVEELKEKDYNLTELKDYLYKFIEYEDNKTIEKNEGKYKAITLTTAHTSKGKEFPVVFNTISKYSAERGNNKSIEEERRLLFVSITRAKEKLFITHQIEKINNFSKAYKEYPIELANTGKCIIGKGVKKENIA